jgi:aryl-alcohol dehydrogenase-like predicted oxidoreductase
MGVDYIDVYQVHWPDPWEQIPLRHTMRALEKLYTEGKIRAIAVSNFAVRDLEEARSHLSKTDIVSNQLRYNILQRDIEEEVLPYCRKEGISILAWSPLAQGALTGKYNARNAPKVDVRKNNVVFERANLARISRLIPVLSKIASGHQCTVAQVALSWLMVQPEVIPIPGAKGVQQAEENAGSVGVHLSKNDLEKIENSLRTVKIDYLPRAS